jgi:hypothetical protein
LQHIYLSARVIPDVFLASTNIQNIICINMFKLFAART